MIANRRDQAQRTTFQDRHTDIGANSWYPWPILQIFFIWHHVPGNPVKAAVSILSLRLIHPISGPGAARFSSIGPRALGDSSERALGAKATRCASDVSGTLAGFRRLIALPRSVPHGLPPQEIMGEAIPFRSVPFSAPAVAILACECFVT